MVLAAVLPKTLRDRLNLHRKAPGMLGSKGSQGWLFGFGALVWEQGLGFRRVPKKSRTRSRRPCLQVPRIEALVVLAAGSGCMGRVRKGWFLGVEGFWGRGWRV